MVTELTIHTPGRGLHEITADITEVVAEVVARTPHTPPTLCTVFVRHTSASLIVQENADPSARHDLEAFFDRIAPEHDPAYSHTAEGPDDMPAHIRAALTQPSVAVPLFDGRLGLGTWQGIYLFEHRRAAHARRVLVHLA